MHGRMADLKRYRAISGERNFIERTKAPIFFEAVSAIEIFKRSQLNLKEKVNSSILKDNFFSRTDLYIFTSMAPELLHQ